MSHCLRWLDRSRRHLTHNYARHERASGAGYSCYTQQSARGIGGFLSSCTCPNDVRAVLAFFLVQVISRVRVRSRLSRGEPTEHFSSRWFVSSPWSYRVHSASRQSSLRYNHPLIPRQLSRRCPLRNVSVFLFYLQSENIGPPRDTVQCCFSSRRYGRDCYLSRLKRNAREDVSDRSRTSVLIKRSRFFRVNYRRQPERSIARLVRIINEQEVTRARTISIFTHSRFAICATSLKEYIKVKQSYIFFFFYQMVHTMSE